MPKYGNAVTDPKLLAQLEGNDNVGLSISNQQSQEGLGTALAYAAPRILGDTARRIYHAVENIPSYYQSAKAGIPALFGEAKEHPLQSGKQLTAGLAEAGQNIFNTPHDIINYLSERLNLVPKAWNEKVQMARMPSDTESMINATFGKPQNLGQEAARFAGRNVEGLTGAAATLPKALVNVTKSADALARGSINPKKISSAIIENYDKALKSAKNDFDKVGMEVYRRRIDQIKDPHLNQLIDAVEPHLPKTAATKKLIANAKKGDFKAIRDLQSDIFNRANTRMGSDLAADRNIGEELHEMRNQINDSVSQHLTNTGNPELAEQLQQGIDKYRQLQKTYHENQHPSIQKMVNPEERIIPKNITDLLSEDSNRMRRLLEDNPYVGTALNKYMLKNKTINRLKKVGYGTAAIAGINLAKPLYDLYKTSHNKGQ